MDGRGYVCSNCGEPCYFDGRMGDGPILYCDCTKPENCVEVPDRIGFYTVYLNDANPIPREEYLRKKKEK